MDVMRLTKGNEGRGMGLMRAKVDKDTCVGCRLCVDACPEVFEMAGEVAIAKTDPVPAAVEQSCREAAKGCPVEAISIEE